MLHTHQPKTMGGLPDSSLSGTARAQCETKQGPRDTAATLHATKQSALHTTHLAVRKAFIPTCVAKNIAPNDLSYGISGGASSSQSLLFPSGRCTATHSPGQLAAAPNNRGHTNTAHQSYAGTITLSSCATFR